MKHDVAIDRSLPRLAALLAALFANVGRHRSERDRTAHAGRAYREQIVSHPAKVLSILNGLPIVPATSTAAEAVAWLKQTGAYDALCAMLGKPVRLMSLAAFRARRSTWLTAVVG